MKAIVGLIGTTSVGKSAVGVELARLLGGEIVSADSMQIYKGMDIGTAKITAEEMRGIKHHMLDVVEPNVNYSSFLYQQRASQIIDNMDSLPIIVGGTGFYFDSLVYPPEFGCVDESRRVELKELCEKKGLEHMRHLLKQLDIDAYNAIDLNNPKRVLRAIEIAERGESLLSGSGKNREPRYDLKLFMLERSRDSLYKQIDLRVDKMVAMGLVEEVRGLVNKYGVCDTSAFQAIGYKEIVEYLIGDLSLSEAIDKIKLNTRHYAKRQVTYFNKMSVVDRIDVEGKTVLDIVYRIKNDLQHLGLVGEN